MIFLEESKKKRQQPSLDSEPSRQEAGEEEEEGNNVMVGSKNGMKDREYQVPLIVESGKKKRDNVQQPSLDLEPSRQEAGEEEEEGNNVLKGSKNGKEDREYQVPLIVESDVDSESDPEAIASDTELLVNERRRGRTRGRTRVSCWVNPREYFNDTLAKVPRCYAGCITCAVACYSCSWAHQLAREKVKEIMLNQLRTVWSTMKQIFCLMKDRRILLSTSLYGLYGYLSLISIEVGFHLSISAEQLLYSMILWTFCRLVCHTFIIYPHLQRHEYMNL